MALNPRNVQEPGVLQELAKAIRFQHCVLLIGLGLALLIDSTQIDSTHKKLSQGHLEELLRRMIQWCVGKEIVQGEIIADFQDMLQRGELEKVERKLQEYLDPNQRQQCISNVMGQNQQQLQYIYRLLAQMPFRAYFTTSYDEFLEAAYKEVREFPELTKFYKSFIQDAVVAYQMKQPFILKLHGDVDPKNPEPIMLSNRFARSYLPEAISYPEQLQELFAKEHALFIGFETVDPDFKGLKSFINRDNTLKRWLLVQEECLVEDDTLLLYEEDKVTTISYTNLSELVSFLQKLQAEAATPQKVNVYTSYASRDRAMRKRLQKHLSNVKCLGLEIVWTDGEIQAGQEVRFVLEERLKTADIMLLLVSADYLNSVEEHHVEFELTRAVQRHTRGQARVIPIILRSCGWEDAPFAHLAVLPANKVPLDLAPNRELVYTEMRKAIKLAIEEWAEKHQVYNG